MKKVCFAIQIILIIGALLSVPVSGAFAGDLGPNYDLIVLAPGKTRTVTCNLEHKIPAGYHTTWILTAGKGTLTFSVAKTSSLGSGAEIIFGMAGFMNDKPLYGTAYGAGKIVKKMVVPDFGIGLLIDGIIQDWGDPLYPVGMSLTFTLDPPAQTPGTSTTTTTKAM
jgi:hypothetical protein